MVTRRSLLVVMLAAVACGAPVGAAPKTAPGPVEVGVVTVAPRAVTLTRELPGRVSALRVAEVRARVNGIVEKRLFEEGSDVVEGTPLYRVEADTYEASVAAARASLVRAESTLTATREQAARDQQLLRSGAVSPAAAERAAATLRTIEAEIAAGRASVKSARLNLGYTTVTAPISGRIGRSIVTEGAYVQQATATLMATIQQIDRVYVDVTQSAAELQRLRRELAGDKLRAPGDATVTLVLEDGSAYPETGTLKFTDVTVDVGTGSVLLRAVFPNPRGELLPGMFVRARIEQGEDPQAILVPQRAVSRDNRGQATVLVVGADHKVERRQVVADRVVGDSWRVVSGLQPGEQIIVDGLQRARPGTEVKAVPAADEAKAPSDTKAAEAPAAPPAEAKAAPDAKGEPAK
jgi:membrane fusion protein (multidrug efflux system)